MFLHFLKDHPSVFFMYIAGDLKFQDLLEKRDKLLHLLRF